MECTFQVQQRQKKIHEGYRQVKGVGIDYHPHKLFLCNDELWVAAWDKGIFVYSLDLEQTKHIEHFQFKSVTGVLKTPTGVIVCDYDTGVHLINHQGYYISFICSGFYSDVCLINRNKFFALEYQKGELRTFVKSKTNWVKDAQFKLHEFGVGCNFDKLYTTSAHVYVGSWEKHCVLVYTLSGEFLYKTGGRGGEVGKFSNLYLVDVDSEGKLLACDWDNHRFQVFDTQTRVWSELSGMEGVKWPFCAGLGDKHLWVAAGFWKSNNQLLRYEAI